MEPLVAFAACLVIYCGYTSALDCLKSWKRHPAPASERRKQARKRVGPDRSVKVAGRARTVLAERAA